MSLQGIFNTSVQAMLSQSQMMSNISTNIANVNTNGYKLQDTHFATLLNHTTPGSKSFFTVNTFDVRRVEKQGNIATTNRTFDLALSGRGFFVTNTSLDPAVANNPLAGGKWQFTRDGALFGKSISIPGYDIDGDSITDRRDTYLTTADGSYVYGWAADENGNFTETDNLSSLTPIVFNSGTVFSDHVNSMGLTAPQFPPAVIPSKATTAITLQANVSSADSGRQNVAVPFVDQLGNSRSLVIGFNAQMGGRWTMDMSCVGVDNQPVDVAFDTGMSGDIQFDGNGRLVVPADGLVYIELADPDLSPQSMTLDLRRVTQFADNGQVTVVNIDQDGFIAGRLQNTYFNNHGVLIGSYSNNELRNLYKLPIATFNAEQNLEARSGNVFERTPEAGGMKLSGLGSPTGTTQIITGALESSNVDLADQFSKMIITQRAYSSAAKVLSTADEMTQAARDLKR